jgi:dihydrodipicolinate synthase/N-acetylneuraminate lyase
VYKDKRFSGVVVPMVTPLNPDFTIDTEAVARIMKTFSENQIHPLILGTTGESSSVDEKESLRFMTAAVAAKGPGQQIYAGLVGNQVDALIARGNQYLSLGADAVVATLPAYYVLTPDQMIGFYTRLADEAKGPVLVYNIKATTQMSIPLEVVDVLSQHPNIYGLKDSERDADRMAACIQRFQHRHDFSYFCGWGAQSAGSLALGADGIVPSTGNIVPQCYHQLYVASLEGDFQTANHWQNQTDQVALFYQKGRTLGQSLAALKVMMHGVGLCGTTMMPPLTELSLEEKDAVLNQFNEFKNR